MGHQYKTLPPWEFATHTFLVGLVMWFMVSLVCLLSITDNPEIGRHLEKEIRCISPKHENYQLVIVRFSFGLKHCMGKSPLFKKRPYDILLSS